MRKETSRGSKKNKNNKSQKNPNKLSFDLSAKVVIFNKSKSYSNFFIRGELDGGINWVVNMGPIQDKVKSPYGPPDNQWAASVKLIPATPEKKWYSTPSSPVEIKYTIRIKQKRHTANEDILNYYVRDAVLNRWDLNPTTPAAFESQGVLRFGIDGIGCKWGFSEQYAP